MLRAESRSNSLQIARPWFRSGAQQYPSEASKATTHWSLFCDSDERGGRVGPRWVAQSDVHPSESGEQGDRSAPKDPSLAAQFSDEGDQFREARLARADSHRQFKQEIHRLLSHLRLCGLLLDGAFSLRIPKRTE